MWHRRQVDAHAGEVHVGASYMYVGDMRQDNGEHDPPLVDNASIRRDGCGCARRATIVPRGGLWDRQLEHRERVEMPCQCRQESENGMKDGKNRQQRRVRRQRGRNGHRRHANGVRRSQGDACICGRINVVKANAAGRWGACRCELSDVTPTRRTDWNADRRKRVTDRLWGAEKTTVRGERGTDDGGRGIAKIRARRDVDSGRDKLWKRANGADTGRWRRC